MNRTYVKSVILLFIFLLSCISVSAKQNIPDDSLGSIQIELIESASSQNKNVEFGLVWIADILEGQYVLKEPYCHSGIELNHLYTANDIQKAAVALKKLIFQPDKTQKTNNEGMAIFDNLETGVYLVYAMHDQEHIEPSLVALPSWNEDKQNMQFHVKLYPKQSSLPILKINKIDSKTHQPIQNNYFEFTLFSDAACQNKITSVSNTLESYVFFHIKKGVWYIKETIAPKGYQLSDEIVKVVFNDKGLFINDTECDLSQAYTTIFYMNSANTKHSINTNGQSNLIWYFTFLILSLWILFLIILKKKKND